MNQITCSRQPTVEERNKEEKEWLMKNPSGKKEQTARILSLSWESAPLQAGWRRCSSFLVIQHLSPDYKSLMADILGKHTAMAVLQVENGMEVKPDTVYLIPPKKNMTLKDGKLILSEIVQGTLNHPIDIFFTSLAAEEKERGIAVILSGTGTDGTSGIKAMKEHGGLVLIQNPETAKFDGMPRSAINTGLADFVLSWKRS